MPILGSLFKTAREKEIERDLAAKQSKAQFKRHILKQKEMSRRLWELAKKAVSLSDTKQFRQIMLQYMWTLEDIKRWERSLLTFEAVEARRDQARATSEFFKSIQSMSKSILGSASPESMAAAQRDLELGIGRAQDMEERMTMILDYTDETAFAPEDMDEASLSEKLKDVERAMADESKHEAQSPLDIQIETIRKQIELEMKKNS